MGEDGAGVVHHPPPPPPQEERKERQSHSAPSSTTQPLDYVPEDAHEFRAFSRAQTSVDIEDYFTGPRDLNKHSKWPTWLRMHGSVMPAMIIPLTFMGAWATAIRLLSAFVYPLAVNTVLLTVLGFVVGLALSFRSTTAYERYNEGRKYWAQLTLSAHSLGRVIWIHGIEREGDLGRQDLLAKVTALNYIVAFAVALKHKLRFEPYTMYDDIAGLVDHLDTFAKEATEKDQPTVPRHSKMKATGEYLGVSFAKSNPQKLLKKASAPVGNLPLEVLSYLASYIDEIIENGQLRVPMQQTLAYNNLAAMNDVLTGCDRISHTPLPLAYSIAISQITWIYVIMLPFQLEGPLKWVAIPATVIASYIILSFVHIGSEIEDPFGYGVNDLPLDSYCHEIAADMSVISSRQKPKTDSVVRSANNHVLFPLSSLAYPVWESRSERVIRDELKFKAETIMRSKYSPNSAPATSPQQVQQVAAEQKGDTAV
ncbi:hypothetical protein CAC42_6695 [Sphaceloma murrayae]|uniref:Uncharacterized protein n=1 Tax=Sphaceloma murrayae TaxID=2082308 RepID=A0A2K1QH10_9PEZI|nr:hypothetical protein CAC42_6695 [Sphaceloma murrayae]